VLGGGSLSGHTVLLPIFLLALLTLIFVTVCPACVPFSSSPLTWNMSSGLLLSTSSYFPWPFHVRAYLRLCFTLRIAQGCGLGLDISVSRRLISWSQDASQSHLELIEQRLSLGLDGIVYISSIAVGHIIVDCRLLTINYLHFGCVYRKKD